MSDFVQPKGRRKLACFGLALLLDYYVDLVQTAKVQFLSECKE